LKCQCDLRTCCWWRDLSLGAVTRERSVDPWREAHHLREGHQLVFLLVSARHDSGKSEGRGRVRRQREGSVCGNRINIIETTASRVVSTVTDRARDARAATAHARKQKERKRLLGKTETRRCRCVGRGMEHCWQAGRKQKCRLTPTHCCAGCGEPVPAGWASLRSSSWLLLSSLLGSGCFPCSVRQWIEISSLSDSSVVLMRGCLRVGWWLAGRGRVEVAGV
jgi:hypothetical protein